MRRIGWLVLALVGAQSALSQQVPLERVRPLREQLDAELSQARWHLGPLRLLPTLRLESLGYTNNATGFVGGEPDYFGTVRGGAQYVLPLGPRVFFHGSVLPSYIWYAHLTQRRAFGGDYMGELAVFFGGLTVIGGGGYDRRSALLSTEVPTQVLQTNASGHFGLELELFSRLSLLGSADGNQFRYHPQLDEFSYLTLIDSNGAAVRGGLKYQFRPHFSISAQVEGTRTTFPNEPGLRDNETTGYLLGITFDRPRLYFNLIGGYRQGRPYNGSTFADYSGPTGSFFTSYFLTHRLELQAYGRRELISSLYFLNPYYVMTTYGGGLGLHVGHRIVLNGFGEYSTNKYPLIQHVGNELIDRRDVGRTWGGGFTMRMVRSFSLNAVATQTKYTSNIPGFDRSILTITSNLVLDVFQWE